MQCYRFCTIPELQKLWSPFILLFSGLFRPPNEDCGKLPPWSFNFAIFSLTLVTMLPLAFTPAKLFSQIRSHDRTRLTMCWSYIIYICEKNIGITQNNSLELYINLYLVLTPIKFSSEHLVSCFHMQYILPLYLYVYTYMMNLPPVISHVATNFQNSGVNRENWNVKRKICKNLKNCAPFTHHVIWVLEQSTE